MRLTAATRNPFVMITAKKELIIDAANQRRERCFAMEFDTRGCRWRPRPGTVVSTPYSPSGSRDPFLSCDRPGFRVAGKMISLMWIISKAAAPTAMRALSLAVELALWLAAARAVLATTNRLARNVATLAPLHGVRAVLGSQLRPVQKVRSANR
jgi:hypothetical protein